MLTDDIRVVAERKCFVLYDYEHHSDKQISTRTKRLQKMVNDGHISIISTKYNKDTPVSHLSGSEKATMRKQRRVKENYNFLRIILEANRSGTGCYVL